MTEQFRENVKAFSHMSIIITFLVVLSIYARVVVIPIAFSLLFAIILNPFVRRLESLRIPRVPGIIVVLITFVLLLSAFFLFSGYQLSLLVRDLPGLQEKILALISDLSQTLQDRFGVSTPERNRYLRDITERAAPFFTGLLQSTGSAFTIILQIPIYVFLLLLYKERFKNFLSAIYKGGQDESGVRIDEVKDVVQGYVLGLFIVICVLAVLNSIGLLILGIKYAVFFGIFSAVLTVIPYIGNFIGGLFPVVVALVTKDTAWYAVGVVAVYAVIQFLEGNFITPNIMGSRVSVNPLVALISMIIGGQILGIAGLIIAIPMVGVLKLLFSHSRTLSPLVILMEDKTPDD